MFAIAITLLIIEIVPPRLSFGTPDMAQVRALGDLTPQILGFFISFAVIGAFWSGHHRAFCLARHWSGRLAAPNLMLLAAIVFMPFATAYSNANIGQRVPTMAYILVLLATGLLNARLTRIVTGRDVTGDDADSDVIEQTRARSWGVVAGAVLALFVAWFEPRYGLLSLLSITLWRRLITSLVERRQKRSVDKVAAENVASEPVPCG